jgi:K+-sensing histidine kinase KdpD
MPWCEWNPNACEIRLLAALSHDLRTPLTVLVGLAESLALTKPPLSPAAARDAEAIQDEARRMSTMVSNLLDMARIESGEVKLNLQWQPLEEVVGSALNRRARHVETTPWWRCGYRVICRWCASMRC